MTELDPHWIARLNAVGGTQARYLWVLFILGIFYAALATGISVPSTTQEVPLVGLRLGTAWVLATAGPVLAFIVLVLTGSLRAWTNAANQLKLKQGDYLAERLDTQPNAVDLAVYTTKESPRFLAVLGYFAYPVVLSAALFEAAWITITHRGSSTLSLTFFFASAVVWIPAAAQVLLIWWRRLRYCPTIWRAQ